MTDRRSHYLHINTEQGPQLDLQSTQIEQGGSRQRVDEQIKVAIFTIGSMENRAKDARVCRMKTCNRVVYSAPLEVKND